MYVVQLKRIKPIVKDIVEAYFPKSRLLRQNTQKNV